MEEKDTLPTFVLATWKSSKGSALGEFHNRTARYHDRGHSCAQLETSSRSRGILHSCVVAEDAVHRLGWIARLPSTASAVHVRTSLLASFGSIRLLPPPSLSSGRCRRASAPRRSSITSFLLVGRRPLSSGSSFRLLSTFDEPGSTWFQPGFDSGSTRFGKGGRTDGRALAATNTTVERPTLCTRRTRRSWRWKTQSDAKRSSRTSGSNPRQPSA